jgi:glycosyltransferase involved in cell wall biosynthesis
MSKKRIAILSSNICALPPYKVPSGFSCAPEWIITNIADGLSKKDWDVTMYASGDSNLSHKLVSAFDKSFEATVGWDLSNPILSNSILAKYDNLLTSKCVVDANKGNYDLILSNLDLKSAPFARLSKVPFVSILHSPLDEDEFLKYYADDQYWISISQNQRKALPQLNYLANIYHGVDTNLFKFNNTNTKPEYLLSLGRITSYKGTHIAIEVAKQTNKKLLICGTPDETNYFKTMVEPHIDNKNIIYQPAVNKNLVPEIMSKAEALLLPIKREEPFGLVITEAMSCGLPVISFKRGSATEIIIHEKTGFLVNNIQEMVESVRKLDTINRADCRQHIIDNFSIQKMVDNYDRHLSNLIKK